MANAQNYTQQRNNRDEVRFDLLEHICVLGTRKDTGWTREANIVAWNGGVAKLDLRDWDPNHERMSKGITLFDEEAEKLTRMLCKRYGIRVVESNASEGGSPEDADDEPSEETGGAA